jgi:AraC-like DNA-binding protein
MDPLSDVLSLLRPDSYAFRGLDAGAPWAICFEAGEGLKCYAVQFGECWLWLDGATEPTRLAAGDFVMLPKAIGFRLGSDREIGPEDAETFFSSFPPGDLATLNGGGSCSGVGGYFSFSGLNPDQLLQVLPPIVHIKNEEDKVGLRWLIERLMRELREPRPGGTLMAKHLAQTLLVEALRLYLDDQATERTGWLFALADRQMSAAITAMHAHPEFSWTVEALAREAGMSRSSFAARFKATVGEPAIEYLTRWRMMLAADRLSRTGVSISSIAADLGYESDSAFSAAFKRVFGCAPRKFVKQLVNVEVAS